jgi:hypothetical protein
VTERQPNTKAAVVYTQHPCVAVYGLCGLLPSLTGQYLLHGIEDIHLTLPRHTRLVTRLGIPSRKSIIATCQAVENINLSTTIVVLTTAHTHGTMRRALSM